MHNTNKIKSHETINKKKIQELIKRINSEEITSVIDEDIINSIAELDCNTINSIFRNSNATVQNMLWSNEIIQRALILGQKDFDNYVCNDKTIRQVENLKKVIKSAKIKKEIYDNNYFLHVVIYGNNIENRFFYSYDLNKVFNSIINSKQYNEYSTDMQQRIISKLNCYTKDLLLPDNFRSKFKNIERLLLHCNINTIDESILKQLTDEELFFIDYLRRSTNKNNTIKKYIIDSIIEKNKPFASFMEEIEEMNNNILRKIRTTYNWEYYYNDISLEDKIYHILIHEMDDELVKTKFLDYLFNCIISNTSIDRESVYNTLKRNYYNELLTKKDIMNLTRCNGGLLDKDIRLLFYLKFNIVLPNVEYLGGITFDQLSKINIKHVNKLAKYLLDATQDEPAAIYGVCIKMYFIFGYERSLEILKGSFGEYNKVFLDNVAKTDVSDVKMLEEGSKYIPDIEKKFINFMFESPKNNHFIDMLNNKDKEIYKNWYILYNKYDEIVEKCHNEITLKKVEAILSTEKYDVNRKIITPDCYLLNNNDFLENVVLGNKTRCSNDSVLRNIIETYHGMQKRVESSIPYVKGTTQSGYKYEMMKFDDPIIFTLGYKANCCIRILDIANNHLLHAALCRNGRILLLYNKLGDLVAFCPLKRNGNVLIVNSIECIDKRIELVGNYINDAFMGAINEIVRISNQSNEPIELVCIGNGSYLKPECTDFPKNFETPTIYEKNDELYKKTDSYHKELCIVYKAPKFSFENIKSKNSEVSYIDPRSEVKHYVYSCYDNNQKEEVVNIINSINYLSDNESFQPINKYLIGEEVYYNKDWYIMKSYYDINGKCLEHDIRAKEEYEKYLNIMNNNKQVLKKELNNKN